MTEEATKLRRNKRKQEGVCLTIIFNGKTYTDEEWKAYCETGEPARITREYFESDACPPDRKAAWNRFWDSVISRAIAAVEEEERQKKEASSTGAIE
jgi:hypothetical protein